MTPESVMTLGIEALKIGLLIAGPLLLAALLTGLVISILQASTQINEMTLSFIPKIMAILLVGVVMGHWMLETMLDYVRALFTNIPHVIG
jgi:flagellar biosynthetic protein FliQ